MSDGIVERSVRYALTTIRFCQTLGSDQVTRVLANQLLRAGTSVGANIHEAQGAQSRPDFVAKMSIAHKEAREAAYWLRLVEESGLSPKEGASELIDETDQVIKILSSILLTSKNGPRPNS